ncbi:MAG TPA: hypothetical protein VMH80_29080 [Bryobacteraceae bacterium]|nr:hypothetical protein [Bryobacteraceae bacterium]
MFWLIRGPNRDDFRSANARLQREHGSLLRFEVGERVVLRHVRRRVAGHALRLKRAHVLPVHRDRFSSERVEPEPLTVDVERDRRGPQEVLIEVAIVAADAGCLPPPFVRLDVEHEVVLAPGSGEHGAQVVGEGTQRHVAVSLLALHDVEVAPVPALPNEDLSPGEVDVLPLESENLADPERAIERGLADQAHVGG